MGIRIIPGRGPAGPGPDEKAGAGVRRPVIAEGGIWTRPSLRTLDTGVWAAVVGTAITRPREITKRFAAAIK